MDAGVLSRPRSSSHTNATRSPRKERIPRTAKSMSNPSSDRRRSLTRESNSVKDATSQYLDEIGSYRRLTRDEEIDLGRRAFDGDDEAAHLLVVHNLRLVVSAAKKFAQKSHRFDVLELCSPGNEGLMVASTKYNPERGVTFGVYAMFWIKQRILKYMGEHGAAVRIPAYRAHIVNKIIRVNARLQQTLGREPTASEVAEQADHSLDEVREVLELVQPELELDAPLKTDDGMTTRGAYWGESPDEADERLEDGIQQMDMESALRKALFTLAPREAEVLQWHFGLGGRRARGLDQIAQTLQVSPERVRQIKSKALRALRSNEALKDFFVED